MGLLRKLNCGGSKAIILVQLRNGAPGGMEGNEIPAPTPTKKGGSEALPRNFSQNFCKIVVRGFEPNFLDC